MALVESMDLPLGMAMPPFTLLDPHGKTFCSEQLAKSKGLLVVFTCNHCPYALAAWPRLIRLAAEAKALDIETVAINPNIHPGYPDDAPDKMIKKIAEWKIPFPYLVDDTQATARAFKAQCTPDNYLFDRNVKLVYHGRIDDNWQDEKKVTRQELSAAIQNLATGREITAKQNPSMGCSIKWK